MGCSDCSDTHGCSEQHDESHASNILSREKLGRSPSMFLELVQLTARPCLEPTLEQESPSCNSSCDSSNTFGNPVRKESVYGLEDGSPDNRVILSFSHGDPENPVNWSSVRFTCTVVV